MKDGNISLQKAEENQNKFTSNLNETASGNLQYKEKYQSDTINNIKNKSMLPKQMQQRLPIALAQVKAGNNSEILLNEIRQIVYSLYQSKEITKKVCNNIIKLMET